MRIATKAATGLLMATIPWTVLTASVIERVRFQDWVGQEKIETTEGTRSFKAWSNGKVLQADSGRGAKTQMQLQVTCTGTPGTITTDNQFAKMFSTPRVDLRFTEAVTGTYLGKQLTGEGYEPGLWLRTRLDEEEAESMSYMAYGGYWVEPTDLGIQQRELPEWIRWMSSGDEGASPATPEEYKQIQAKSRNLFQRAHKALPSVRALGLDDLKRHRRMRLEVGLRPEEEAQTDFYYTPSKEKVVFEISLMGATKAIQWAQGGCQRTNAMDKPDPMVD